MRLLTVAEGLRISEATVRRLIKRGDLPAHRVGDRRQLRVRAEDLDSYLESMTVEPLAAKAKSPSIKE